MIAQLGLLALAVTSGCTTTLTPDGHGVRVTRESADVAGCRSVGFVDANPPFSTPKDAENEMKNKTAILGGNVLLITNDSLKATGVAYSCTRAPTATP